MVDVRKAKTGIRKRTTDGFVGQFCVVDLQATQVAIGLPDPNDRYALPRLEWHTPPESGRRDL